MGTRLTLGVILVVGAAAAAGLLLSTNHETQEQAIDAEATPASVEGGASAAKTATLEGRRAHPVPGTAPAEAAVVLHDPVERDRVYIGHATLGPPIIKRMYTKDERVSMLVPALDRVIQEGIDNSPTGMSKRYPVWRAMVVVMRTEGSRRYLRQLGRWAAAQHREVGERVRRSQGNEAGWFGWGPQRLDPTTGRALYILYWHATNEAYAHTLRDTLFAAGDLLADDPKAGRTHIAEAMRDARGEELDAVLHAAAALSPVPAAFGPAFTGAFARANTEHRQQLLRRLSEEGGLSDFAAEGVGKTIAEYLVRSWQEYALNLQGLVVQVLGRLDAPSPPVLQHLLGLLTTRQVREAIEALGELGTGAASTAPVLIAKLGDHATYGPHVSRAVARMGNPRDLPYLAMRLAVGDEEERRDIAVALADLPEAVNLDAMLLDEVRRGSWAALKALVGRDLGATEAVTTEALHLSLRPTAPKSQKLHALLLSRELEQVPDVVVDAMLKRLEDEDVWREAVRAVQALGRLGETAHRWKDRLMLLQADAEARREPQTLRAVLGLLGEIAGQEADVRARLFELLDRYAARAADSTLDAQGVAILQAVLWGLGGVEDPSRDQVKTVARLKGFRTKGVEGIHNGYHLMGLALRLLGKPSWHRVRLREGIGLSSRPRVREPSWGHDAPERASR